MSDTGTKPWQVLGRRTVYASDWMNMEQWDVRLPDGSRIPDHHVVTFPREAVGIVPVGADGRILCIDHYRFQTDSRGWEIPAGQIEAGESLLEAAVRELHEETGYAAREWQRLGAYNPSAGSSNQVFHIFIARGVHQIGAVIDTNETLGLRWFDASDLRGRLVRNEIRDGFSLTGLLWAFAAGLDGNSG
ncbi:MAG: NUDIX hydrolase [Anaerolineales bacterium]